MTDATIELRVLRGGKVYSFHCTVYCDPENHIYPAQEIEYQIKRGTENIRRDIEYAETGQVTRKDGSIMRPPAVAAAS